MAGDVRGPDAQAIGDMRTVLRDILTLLDHPEAITCEDWEDMAATFRILSRDTNHYALGAILQRGPPMEAVVADDFVIH